MESRRSTTGLLAAMFCLSWMVGFVTPTSMHAHSNSSRHDHGLRSATSKTSSLGDSDNDLLNELKEIVLFLSQKIDDSDVQIQSLEDKVRAQGLTIQSLQRNVKDASSFHRYLQSDNSDCLPKFRNTTFGPRCDFDYVTRFQNRTFFNDGAVFNENVEFDSDANCMPTFNSTTKMCRMNNNFTFDDGDIIFDHSVRFDEDVRFNDDVRFRDTVKMESDVEFNDGGEVTFNKDTKFHEDVLVKNVDHTIEFKLEGKVDAKFYQDPTFKIDTHTTFYQDVTMEEDLHVDGMTELDDVELTGYLWVDKKTRLDGELEANHHATIKSGLTVATGGLDVSRDGAEISGTTVVDGTFQLNGQGWASRDFKVDGKLTASSVLIDNTQTHSRILEVHDPTPAPVPASGYALEVNGPTNIFGTLTADRIRSGDINNNNSDNIKQILNQIKIELKNEILIVGDVTVLNNLDIPEPVLTESRMKNLMDSMTLKVGSIIANSAIINGQSVPNTPEELASSLSNQSLDLSSINANIATIGGKSYPHTDSGNSDMTIDEILDLLKGQRLDVESVSASSVDTNTATIGGEAYSQSSSGDGFDIEDIVDELMKYDGEVTIPNLFTAKLDVTSAVRSDGNGNIVEVPGELRVGGVRVATQNDIDELESSNTEQQGCSLTEVLQALEGATLVVASLDTTSLTKSGTEVATMDDVSNMIEGTQVAAADNTESSCTCSTSNIEAVVTTTFMKGIVDETYLKLMGFITRDEMTDLDFGSDCTCSGSDVQDNIDRAFLETLEVSFTDDESQACSCSSESILEVITSGYIQSVMDEVNVAYGNTEATCTCSSEDILAVVTEEYILDFVKEPDCSCSVESGEIMSDVETYIDTMGFLTTCSCGDTYTHENYD